ncbi:MAG: TraB/GumN family protein [Treponema sp.]|nr:TraB/GumN family protein [Treponema sp.]MCL2251092.1 TraB/GumN family protein [Treponema sp.]
MKRIIYFLFVILFFTSNFLLSAAAIREYYDKPSLQEESNFVPADSVSSVWKITKNGNTLFLGGSIHVLRETDFPLPEQFDTAFYASDILVLETDTEQLSTPEVQQYLLSQIFLPDHKRLQDILEEDTYELLSSACIEYGLSIDEFARMKPSMVINILNLFQIQKYGFVQQGIDEYYFEKAKSEKKPVSFLESVQVQINMLMSMGDGYENDYVRYSVEDIESDEAELIILLYEWKNGTSEISNNKRLIEMKEDWPQIYQSLISSRHNEWLPQIKEFLESGKTCFVIVGLLHMHGPDGILQYLESIGCVIEQF